MVNWFEQVKSCLEHIQLFPYTSSGCFETHGLLNQHSNQIILVVHWSHKVCFSFLWLYTANLIKFSCFVLQWWFQFTDTTISRHWVEHNLEILSRSGVEHNLLQYTFFYEDIYIYTDDGACFRSIELSLFNLSHFYVVTSSQVIFLWA